MSSITTPGGRDNGGLRTFADQVPAQPRTTTVSVLLGLILLLAAFLRIIYLRDKSFWLDEWISIGMARLDWHGLLRALADMEVNMALYHVTLKAWLRIYDNELFIRSLSVVTGLLTLPVLYRLGTILFGWRAGLVASFLLAINAFHIRYSQEARSYSLATFLVVCSSLLFVNAIKSSSRKYWVYYALVSAMAVYVHLFAVLVLAGHAASLLFLRPQLLPQRRLVTSWACMATLVLPFMAFALTRDRGQVDWIEQPTPHAVLLLIREMVGYGRIWLPALYAAFSVLAGVQLARYAREQGRGTDVWRYALVLLWLTLPTLLVIALSSVKPLLVNRYLIVSLPALSLFAAAGVDRLRWTSLRLTALLVLAGFSLHGIQGYFRNYWPASPIPDKLDQFRFPYLREEIGRENWAAVAEALYSQAGPEDAVLVTYRFDTVPLEHYRQRLNVDSKPTLVFPRYWPDRSNRAGPGKQLLEQLPTEYERVWVVMRNSEDSKVFGGQLRRKIYEASILAPLNRLYAESTRRVFRGITLILFARPHRSGIVRRQPA